MKIGLLGGSFNPPHQGHMHIATTALRRYKFHAVWWLVSPQNPLKKSANNFSKRMDMTRRYLRHHPKMMACDIESQMGIQYSYQTVARLQRRFPKTHFTWIAGMDNACLFHKWDRWQDLLHRIPFIFFNRPPNTMAMNNNPVRMLKTRKDVKWDMKGKTRNISSTALRNKGIVHFLKSKL